MNEIAAYIDSLLQFDTTVQILNIDLSMMVQDIEAFDEQITTLNDSIGQLSETIAAISVPERSVISNATSSSVVHYNSATSYQDNVYNNTSANDQGGEEGEVQEGDDFLSDAKGVFKKLKTGANIAKYGLKALKATTGRSFPKVLNVVKKASEFFGLGEDVTEFGEALEGISAVVETGSALEAASGIAAAVAGVPVAGWIVGGAVLAGGYYMDRQKAKREEWERQQKNEHEAIATYATDKKEINEYVNETPAPLKVDHKQLKQLKVDPQKNDIFSTKLGDDIRIAPLPGITGVADGVANYNRLNIPPQPVSAAKVTRDISDILYNTGLDGAYGKEKLNSQMNMYLGVAKTLDSRFPFLHATDIVSNAEQQAKSDLSIRAFRDKEAADIKKKMDAEKQAANRQMQGGNTIVLNINKSLIENFTVNATSVKESATEIRRIVEQTIIDTLQHIHTNG